MTSVLLIALGVFLALFVLVFAGKLGTVMIEKDPHSAWGEFLVMVGIAGRRAIRALAEKSPIARAIQHSLPDSDPPPREAANAADRTPVGPRRLPPPLPAIVFAALALGSAGCLGAKQLDEKLDQAADAIRAGSELATFAEPRLRALYGAEIAECLKNPDTDDAATCVATVRKVYGPARAALETMRAVRCAAKREPECDEPVPAWGEPEAAR